MDTHISFIITHVDIVLVTDQTIELVKGFGQFLWKVRGSWVLEALDQTVSAACVEATLRISGHGVDQRCVGIQFTLGMQIIVPDLIREKGERWNSLSKLLQFY